MIAGRPKDLEFGRVLLAEGLVEPGELQKRLGAVDGLANAVRDGIDARMRAWGST